MTLLAGPNSVSEPTLPRALAERRCDVEDFYVAGDPSHLKGGNQEGRSVVKLIIEPREAGYARGQEIYENILQASFEIVIEEGLDALSFGNIARRLDTKAANVNYYFPSKEALLTELLNAIMTSYQHTIESISEQDELEPKAKFQAIVQMIILDLTAKETTRVFPELWARSNHDESVQDRLFVIYEFGRTVITRLIAQMRPDLSAEHHELLGYHTMATFEGLTIFAGYNKPLAPKIKQVANIAEVVLIEGILKISAEDIDADSEPSRRTATHG